MKEIGSQDGIFSIDSLRKLVIRASSQRVTTSLILRSRNNNMNSSSSNSTGRGVRIDGKRQDGLTASNVNTRNGNVTILPYGSGSDGKCWISSTFHTVDGHRRRRKRTKRLHFE